MKRELLIFAKYPEPGRVKTRLARTIGEVEAARRYREMIETVVRNTAPLPLTPSLEGRGNGEGEYHRTLCFDPPERRDDFQRWFPNLDLMPQVEGDLGTRMQAAFRSSFLNPPQGGFANLVIIIGSDCADVDWHLVVEAFQKLIQNDLVIGPAKDGGYYLIGMKKAYPFLFEGISWSTEKVLDENLEKAKENNLKVELLRTLSDLDEKS